jgi:hypothetical protein
MQKQMAAGFATFGLLFGIAWAQEAPTQPEQSGQLEELEELETVVVTGEAVPRLWKVSQGDHVLWVTNNAMLAAGRKWRTDAVDARVAESQLVLYPGRAFARPDVGLLKGITLLPAAFKAAKNPDKKTLKDVLPAETYARWRVLKTTYVGRDNDIEKWRPFIAIVMLEDKVLEMPLPEVRPKRFVPGPTVQSVVEKAVKKHKVKHRTMPTVERVVKSNARKILKSAHHIELGDVLCFTQSLDYLERTIEFSKQRAAVLASSESPAPASDAEPPRRVNCDDALIKGLRSGEIPDPAGALKVFDEFELQNKLSIEQLDAEWIAAAQAAIAKNRTTFAVVPTRATSETGYFAKLKALGYTVELPQ